MGLVCVVWLVGPILLACYVKGYKMSLNEA